MWTNPAGDQDGRGAPPPPGGLPLTEKEWVAVAGALNWSAQELQIIRRIFTNETIKTIAREMGIGEGTAKQYRARAYDKADVHSHVELARRIMEVLKELSAPKKPRKRRKQPPETWFVSSARMTSKRTT